MPKATNLLHCKNGMVVEDLGAAQQEAASKIAAANPDKHKLHLRELPGLEQEIFALQARAGDRQRFIDSVKPGIPELEAKVKGLQDELNALNDAINDGVVYAGAKTQAEGLRKKLEYAEWDLRTEKERLGVAERILAATKKLIAEWEKENGGKLRKLRALTPDTRKGSVYRASGDRGDFSFSISH